MIPTDADIQDLWTKYKLPEQKQVHMTEVARVAQLLAEGLAAKNISINIPLLIAAAKLHDIDKSIQKQENEHHPDTAVRILGEEGFGEVGDLVKTHPLHAILDQNISPKTWEEKILYLSDKMVKQHVVGVDGRFDLWRAERLPPDAVTMLANAYPAVKKLEAEVAQVLGIDVSGLTKLASEGKTSTI